MAELAQAIDPNASADPTSPGYLQRANTLYSNSQISPYAAALKNVQGDMSARGLSDSGIGAQGELNLAQERARGAQDFAGKTIQQGGQLSFQAAEAQKQRDFAQQQQQRQIEEENQMFQQENEARNRQQQGQLIGSMLGGVGGITGSLLSRSMMNNSMNGIGGGNQTPNANGAPSTFFNPNTGLPNAPTS